METFDQEIKKDAGKNRLDLIPVECVKALGEVLTMGAEKYHDNSWREGMNYSRVYAATQRHLQAFWGEDSDVDEESKLPHLFHALCNIAFLITYEKNKERYRTFDDRAGSNNEFYKEREELIEDINKLVQDNPSFFECGVGDDTLQKAYDALDYAINAPFYISQPDFPDLTEMTHPEACEHLEVGMRVRILRKARDRKLGWENCWIPEMDCTIGDEYTVTHINICGVCFDEAVSGYPAFVLKIISKPDQDLTTSDGVPGGDSSCTKDWKDR